MRALIIEKDQLIASALAESLADLGFTSFHFVLTEVDAVAVAEHWRPDFIIADVSVSMDNGIGVVATICAVHTFPTVFMIAGSQEGLNRMPEAVVLRMPFGEVALKTAVSEVMSRKRTVFIG